MVHIIVYDLMRPGQAYSDLHDYIKRNAGAGLWAHPEGSVWFVDTTLTTKQWREGLKTVTDTNDKIIVARLGGAMAWTGPIPDNVATWFKSDSRRW